MDEVMRQIGEVANEVGLSLRTIRHYEEVGLVPPSGRSSGGFRLYTDDDIEQLRLVKDLKPLQFSLEEMKQVLEIRERLTAAEPGSEEHQHLVGLLAGFAAVADERCEQLRDQLATSESVARLLHEEASGKRSIRSTR